MKFIISILITLSSLNLYAGQMSTIDLLVREAASEEYGYVFYNDWVMDSSKVTPGCLMTVTAKASYYTKGVMHPIEASFCINRDEQKNYTLTLIEGE